RRVTRCSLARREIRPHLLPGPGRRAGLFHAPSARPANGSFRRLQRRLRSDRRRASASAQPTGRSAMMLVHDHDANGDVATLTAHADAPAPAQARAAPASWTVLAYLAGDNDLEGSLLGDLREMERVGSRPGSVEIIAQIDRAPGYDASRGDWT